MPDWKVKRGWPIAKDFSIAFVRCRAEAQDAGEGRRFLFQLNFHRPAVEPWHVLEPLGIASQTPPLAFFKRSKPVCLFIGLASDVLAAPIGAASSQLRP